MARLNLELDLCREIAQLSGYMPLLEEILSELLLSEPLFSQCFSAIEEVSIEISVIENSQIQELNSEYRGKNNATDVLSFPVFEDLRTLDAQIDLKSSGPLVSLGSIFIAFDVMDKQATEYNISMAEEFIHLVVHGFLHLCGFDHEIGKAEEELMSLRESQILAMLAKRRNN